MTIGLKIKSRILDNTDKVVLEQLIKGLTPNLFGLCNLIRILNFANFLYFKLGIMSSNSFFEI